MASKVKGRKAKKSNSKKQLPSAVKSRQPNPPTQANPNRFDVGIDWPTAIWIGVIHIGALAAPFVITWQAVVLAAVLAWYTGSIGVCMGYHRLLTHGSFCTYRPVRWFLAFSGQMSGEGSALMWVANHRKHHLYSDKDGDPHTPFHGKWWAHMFWFMPRVTRPEFLALVDRYAPDLGRDRVMHFLDRMFLPSHIAMTAILYSIGYFGWDNYTGWSFVVWGMFVRLCYVLHVTWFVNSASHVWGYRNYETSDNSRNLWWVGLLAFGEGWHNNHHAYQRMAKQGHKWWELDITYWVILLMEKTGLAWNVVKEIPRNAKPA